MTETERLQKVASLMARRLSAGPLLTVRADRWTRAAMTVSCVASVFGCGVLIAAADPATSVPAVSTREPATLSDGDLSTPGSTIAGVDATPPPPPRPNDDGDDDGVTYGRAAVIEPPIGTEAIDAITGGS